MMETTENAKIRIKDLRKFFQISKDTHVHAVEDVSFDIMNGEVLGLVGESGSGKTTIGRTILRLIEANGGSVLFNDKDILELDVDEMKEMRKEMQIIFQDPFSSLNPRKSVFEIVSEPLKLQKYGNRKKIRERAEYLIERVGLHKQVMGSYPHELDGGRCQRVGIARAIALEPSFIVCDEPVSALDVSAQAQIMNLLEELKREIGLTYLFISHDLSVVRRLSDRIVVLYLGKVMELASAKKLFDSPQHPYTQALLSAVPTVNIDIKRERIILEGDVPTPINFGQGCRFYSRCKQAMDECKNKTPELKEIDSGHLVSCHLYN